MKSPKNYFLAASGILILLVSLVFSMPRPAQGGGNEPVGPTKPVEVVNTSAKPVPITGTVTGNITGNVNITNTPTVNAQQSGSWNVGLVGTPTVKIDPSANAVSVTPAGQTLVFDSGFISPPNAAFTDIPVNVQSYSKIRVFGINSSNANGDVITYSSLPGAVVVQLDSFSLGPGHRFTQLYEVVGSTLLLRVASCNGCSIRLWVYGS